MLARCLGKTLASRRFRLRDQEKRWPFDLQRSRKNNMLAFVVCQFLHAQNKYSWSSDPQRCFIFIHQRDERSKKTIPSLLFKISFLFTYLHDIEESPLGWKAALYGMRCLTVNSWFLFFRSWFSKWTPHHPSHNPWSVLLTASFSLMTFDPGTLPFERLSQNKEDTVWHQHGLWDFCGCVCVFFFFSFLTRFWHSLGQTC